MQLKSLRLLMAVAETGSFIGAAEKLHTVQSNVTAHIKKLEEELGSQLIQRGGRARLTSAGRALVDYAERILSAHDEAVSLFQNQQRPSGRLRLGAMETTTALRLPPILASYHAQYPEVDLQLKTGPSGELIEQLLAGQLDGVFVAGRVEVSGYYQRPAFCEELVLVVPSPLAGMPSAEDLLTSTFLAFRQGCSYRQRIELLLASRGVNAGRIFELGSLDAMLGCVAAGMGYALLPEAIVQAHQQRFNVGFVRLPDAIAKVDTYFAAAEPASWTPALAGFNTTLDAAIATSRPNASLPDALDAAQPNDGQSPLVE